MSDFEVHPVGTKARLSRITREAIAEVVAKLSDQSVPGPFYAVVSETMFSLGVEIGEYQAEWEVDRADGLVTMSWRRR